MKDNVEKMVEEYFIKNGISPNDCVQVGERVVHYKKLTTDFALFYHEQEMEKGLTLLRNRWKNELKDPTIGKDYGKIRDRVEFLEEILSDLTKTE